MKKILLLVAMVITCNFTFAQQTLNLTGYIASNTGCTLSGQYVQLAGNVGFLNVDTTVITNLNGDFGIVLPYGFQGTMLAILQDSNGNWATDCNGNYVIDSVNVIPTDTMLVMTLISCCNGGANFQVNGYLDLNCNITLPAAVSLTWQSGGATGTINNISWDANGNFFYTIPKLNNTTSILIIASFADANGLAVTSTYTFNVSNGSGSVTLSPCSNIGNTGTLLAGFLDSNGNLIPNYSGSLSLDCGITFSNITTNAQGYFVNSYSIDSIGSCVILMGSDCNNNPTTTTIAFNGDTSIFINAVGCSNTVNNFHSLCVYAYPQDSNLVNEETEFYLIQSFTTSNGDSLALVNSSIPNPVNGAYFCFDSLTDGVYYVKAALTPNAADYANYIPTYYTSQSLWADATPINLNTDQYITIVLTQATNIAGPGFVGGYVSQGANRMDETEAVGDPMNNIPVILTTVNNIGVASVVTNAFGHYQIQNIPNGTYKIWADQINKICTPILVTIGGGTTSYVDANFQVNSSNVVGGLALNTNGTEKIKVRMNVLANPVEKDLKLLFNGLTSGNNYSITITDVLGRKILTDVIDEATTNKNINVATLKSGMYFINFSNGDNKQVARFIKQ